MSVLVSTPGSGPEDLHEWVAFVDPDEDRTWMFDATFLLSNWKCIYGEGCKGILTEAAEELAHGCCSYGAHFIDDEDRQDVEAAIARLTPAQWQFRRAGKRGGVFSTEPDGSITTRVYKGACIFLNRTGFARGAGCALHVGALDAGERPLDWKPDVCWQVPVRRHDHVDEHGHVTSMVREWKRRDWGDGGQEFHWWCTETPEAFVGHQPTFEYLRDEIGAHV